MQEIKESDKLCLEARKKLSMTGVEVVNSFSDRQITLTVSGDRVTINGEGLKITSFNKATGCLVADGKFNEIKYGVKKTSLYKKLVK